MPSFSASSAAKLAECHLDIQRLLNEAIKYWDFTVVTGRRTRAEQERAFQLGYSNAHWPDGPHCVEAPGLSWAVDIAPFPIDWENDARFLLLGGKVLGLAQTMGIVVRYGGDWDGDGNPRNQSLNDTGHFEIPKGAR